MSHLAFITAAGGLLGTLLWLGKDREDHLRHTLLRPALLALMALLLLILAQDGPAGAGWPAALVALAAVTGLWESYGGVYTLLSAPPPRTSPVAQVRICFAWLINVLANLTLLNLAALLAFPATFAHRDNPASALDVAYFTLLTFASGGYGDVLPTSGLGKGLAMLTSLAGLTYATILFAALFQRLRAD